MSSMRAMGYTFEAAVADVIDNSITAKASNIKIIFPMDPMECFVAIVDDGYGMSNESLYLAMKYGSSVKDIELNEYDLGRFGLGLKSASLSQCKRLTVVSKKEGLTSAYVWDLDFIQCQKDWLIQELDKEEIYSVPCIELLDEQIQGTLVVWESFDIIEKTTGDVFTTLSDYKEPTAKYLSLIFHRFLNNEKGRKVIIRINEYTLEGLDPFLENHNKTNPRKEMIIPIEDSEGIERYIKVKPYVLPFQKDLTAKDKKLLGGIEDYRTKQGFYIYRNERLIIWGTWFGRTRHELTKHARIKVDIPNTLDDIWGIDIKKQSAVIPGKIKTQLRRAVDEAMQIAIKSQEYRGRIEKIDENFDYIWNRVAERENRYLYKINRESKLFQMLKENIDDTSMSWVEMVLEEIENGLPYQQIYIDMSQQKVADEVNEERIYEVENKALILIDLFKRMGKTDETEIINDLFLSEPFCKYPQIKEKLLETLINIRVS